MILWRQCDNQNTKKAWRNGVVSKIVTSFNNYDFFTGSKLTISVIGRLRECLQMTSWAWVDFATNSRFLQIINNWQALIHCNSKSDIVSTLGYHWYKTFFDRWSVTTGHLFYKRNATMKPKQHQIVT